MVDFSWRMCLSGLDLIQTPERDNNNLRKGRKLNAQCWLKCLTWYDRMLCGKTFPRLFSKLKCLVLMRGKLFENSYRGQTGMSEWCAIFWVFFTNGREVVRGWHRWCRQRLQWVRCDESSIALNEEPHTCASSGSPLRISCLSSQKSRKQG